MHTTSFLGSFFRRIADEMSKLGCRVSNPQFPRKGRTTTHSLGGLSPHDNQGRPLQNALPPRSPVSHTKRGGTPFRFFLRCGLREESADELRKMSVGERLDWLAPLGCRFIYYPQEPKIKRLGLGIGWTFIRFGYIVCCRKQRHFLPSFLRVRPLAAKPLSLYFAHMSCTVWFFQGCVVTNHDVHFQKTSFFFH